MHLFIFLFKGKLAMMIDDDGKTALHAACNNNASFETINALITVGGRELVMMNTYKGTALHLACKTYNASFDTIDALITIGGRELVMITNICGRTALHIACFGNASVDIINALIDIGGNLLLTANDDEGKFPLISSLLNSSQPTNRRINKISSTGTYLINHSKRKKTVIKKTHLITPF
jgi:ankyrin repeat protein